MLEKSLFRFNDHDLLIHEDVRQELWFRGTNVCSILGFANSSETLRLHVNEYLQELAIGEGKPALYVAEKGLYILAFKAKTPVALEFQLWAADIIKTIRKTGKYEATAADQQHFHPFGITLQQKIEECDRAVGTAEVGTGKISKILADRKALEAAIKIEAKTKTETKQAINCEQRVLDRIMAVASKSAKPVSLSALYRNVKAIRTIARHSNTPVSHVALSLCHQLVEAGKGHLSGGSKGGYLFAAVVGNVLIKEI
jgi:prophage antirepressor-like protein